MKKMIAYPVNIGDGFDIVFFGFDRESDIELIDKLRQASNDIMKSVKNNTGSVGVYSVLDRLLAYFNETEISDISFSANERFVSFTKII